MRPFYISSVTKKFTSKTDPNAIEYRATDKSIRTDSFSQKSIKIGDSRILERLQTPDKFKEQRSEEATQAKKDYNKRQTRSKINERLLSDEVTDIKSSTDFDITTTIIDAKATSKRLSKALHELTVEFNEDGDGEGSPTTNTYSYKLEYKSKQDKYSTGTIYDRKKQEEVIELFERANLKLKEHEEKYGIQLGTGFTLYENSSPFSIERKVVAAQNVLKDEYVELLANTYKLDAIETYINHVDRTAISDLMKTLPHVDRLDFLRYMKKYNLAYVPHAYDSDLPEEEYQRLDAQVRTMTAELKKLIKPDENGGKKDERVKKK